jgi:hypothetical protein
VSFHVAWCRPSAELATAARLRDHGYETLVPMIRGPTRWIIATAVSLIVSAGAP